MVSCPVHGSKIKKLNKYGTVIIRSEPLLQANFFKRLRTKKIEGGIWFSNTEFNMLFSGSRNNSLEWTKKMQRHVFLFSVSSALLVLSCLLTNNLIICVSQVTISKKEIHNFRVCVCVCVCVCASLYVCVGCVGVGCWWRREERK